MLVLRGNPCAGDIQLLDWQKSVLIRDSYSAFDWRIIASESINPSVVNESIFWDFRFNGKSKFLRLPCQSTQSYWFGSSNRRKNGTLRSAYASSWIAPTFLDLPKIDMIQGSILTIEQKISLSLSNGTTMISRRSQLMIESIGGPYCDNHLQEWILQDFHWLPSSHRRILQKLSCRSTTQIPSGRCWRPQETLLLLEQVRKVWGLRTTSWSFFLIVGITWFL